MTVVGGTEGNTVDVGAGFAAGAVSFGPKYAARNQLEINVLVPWS